MHPELAEWMLSPNISDTPANILNIDKVYGIKKLRDTLGIAIQEMIFIGDALFPGGNDYPAKEAGVVSIQVRYPNETKRVIEAILACLDGVQPTKIRDEENWAPVKILNGSICLPEFDSVLKI